MVHVKKCPCEEGRGKPTTEFYINGKPQIYCYGWENMMFDEPLECCKKCADWVYGEQCEKDFEEAKANGFKSNKFHSKYKWGTKEYLHDYYEQVIKPRKQARKRGRFGMTKQECAIVMAYTGTVMLTGDYLGIYYKYLEEILGRPVWTHELADKAVQKEIKEKSLNDFLKLCREATDEN